MNLQFFIRSNKLTISIILFLMVFFAFHTVKPGFAYNNEGGFRPFGLGYRSKTVIPIWLIAIVLAILCYVLVSFIAL